MDLANPLGASVSEAAEKLSGILSEPSTPTAPKGNPEPEPSQEPINKSQEQETPQSDTEAPSRRRKAKLGDREIEFEVLTDDVDLDLIPKGLMMENDYRQKTMSLADEKKAFEARKSELDQALADLQDSVLMQAEQLDTEEMKELKELDPDQYWKKFDEVKSQAEKLKSYKEKRDSELLEQQQDFVNQEVARYTEVIPEWLDDNVKSRDIQTMVNFLGKSGFNDQEIGSLYDSRMMSVVRKAALFDQISSKNIESKRVATAPKSSKPAANTGKAEKTATQKSFERLKKTGKMHDAQAAIKNLILGG
jgi:ribonuclease HII